jgi:hypothetical protein
MSGPARLITEHEHSLLYLQEGGSLSQRGCRGRTGTELYAVRR